MRLAESHPDPWYGRYARHVRLRQGSRALFSPAVRRDPQATLDFGREAAWYLQRVHAQRTQADRNLIERLAAHIALPRALPSARSPVRSISVIPVFALERNLTRSFASYGDEPEGHCFLLW